MTGHDLRQARQNAGWTQAGAAHRLDLTQAYLSMVENGQRVISAKLEKKALAVMAFPATALPLQDLIHPVRRDFQRALGALEYPGFSHLSRGPRQNPAQLLLEALDQPDLDARVTEALPWLVLTYADMNWEWLLNNAKLCDRQNRLGFVVALADDVLQERADKGAAPGWREYVPALERSRLAMEDTLCHDSMTQAERTWLRQNRPRKAEHWNLLTDLRADHLAYTS